MLFTFNHFWKYLAILLGSWAIYGLFGFEFATVSLLAAILMVQINNLKN